MENNKDKINFDSDRRTNMQFTIRSLFFLILVASVGISGYLSYTKWLNTHYIDEIIIERILLMDDVFSLSQVGGIWTVTFPESKINQPFLLQVATNARNNNRLSYTISAIVHIQFQSAADGVLVGNAWSDEIPSSRFPSLRFDSTSNNQQDRLGINLQAELFDDSGETISSKQIPINIVLAK